MEIIWLQIIADISKITKSADRKPTLIFPELLKSAITFSQKSLLFLKKKKSCLKQIPLNQNLRGVITSSYMETFPYLES